MRMSSAEFHMFVHGELKLNEGYCCSMPRNCARASANGKRHGYLPHQYIGYYLIPVSIIFWIFFFSVAFSNENAVSRVSAIGEQHDYASPLVLDLDGDGLELTNLRGEHVYFDIDQDGHSERTGWVDEDDGLLVWDKNGNGLIDDASELFGYGSTYSIGYKGRGPGRISGPASLDIHFSGGFGKLSKFDSDANGVIDRRDERFSLLQIWQDKGRRGLTETGELVSLTQAGVKSISLKSIKVDEKNEGNLITDRSTYTSTDGQQRIIADVWFRFDQRYSSFNNSTRYSKILPDLPVLHDVGRLNDLRHSMLEDEKLKALVQEFSDLDVSELHRVSALVDDILYRWAKIPTITDAFSRGSMVDTRNVAFMEARTDTAFQQKNGLNVTPIAGAIISERHKNINRLSAFKMIVQSAIGKEIFPELSWGLYAFIELEKGIESHTLIDRIVKSKPENWAERLAHYHSGFRILDRIYLDFIDVEKADDEGKKYKNFIEKILREDGFDIAYVQLIAANIDGAKNNKIVTQSRSGKFYSSHVPVTLTGSGNDEVQFGHGPQLLFYGRGQGNDTVHINPFRYQRWNIIPKLEIRLPELSRDEVEFKFGPSGDTNSTDSVLVIKDTGETLTFINVLQENSEPVDGTIVFEDGTKLSFQDTIYPSNLLRNILVFSGLALSIVLLLLIIYLRRKARRQG